MNKLPDIKKDFAQWYQEVVKAAEMAETSPVRGCMVIKPYGYAIWEHIKDRLNQRIKETGHKNVSFPLFIPESFFKKEAEHVEGFAPELAVVTHAGGKELEESLVVRPTSETMAHYMFAKWIRSWRDLPLKLNQWANVVRWEMRPRAFLRTTEFFWQEGHSAYATHDEAQDDALMMLNEYVDLAKNYLAIPVIPGRKSNAEKFPGAEVTYTFEAIMQDGKALQMGTSHVLSQSFAKSFDMKFQDKEGKEQYPYLTSFGATTRLVGAVVMVHGDQKGLVLPPKIAPVQVVIIPILKKNVDNKAVLDAVNDLARELVQQNIRVEVDQDEHKSPGAKFFHWEVRGVPVRIELGPRDLENEQVTMVTRTGLKKAVRIKRIASEMPDILDDYHKELFTRAQEYLKVMWHKEAKLGDFGKKLEKENGAYQTGWCQSPECEAQLKQYKATTRCILEEKTFDTCFACDKLSISDVLIAKAY